MASILVIIDQDPIRMLLRSVLEADGHDVTKAPHGRLGLALYRDRPVDLMITGIYMPEMEGLDLILELTQAFLNCSRKTSDDRSIVESHRDCYR